MSNKGRSRKAKEKKEGKIKEKQMKEKQMKEKQMKEKKGAAFLVAAAASGSGKTVISCGLMSALKERGMRVAGCKCGPDYIDPMFHREVLGVDSQNLDLFFCSPRVLEALFEEHAEKADVIVAEGVMGYFDGMSLGSERASSYDVARTLNLPVILILPCKGMALSALPVILGILGFKKDSHIEGIILNRISEGLFKRMRDVLESGLKEAGYDIPVLGYVPENPAFSLESRHLGLVTPEETDKIKEQLKEAGHILSQTIDLDRLLALTVRNNQAQGGENHSLRECVQEQNCDSSTECVQERNCNSPTECVQERNCNSPTECVQERNCNSLTECVQERNCNSSKECGQERNCNSPSPKECSREHKYNSPSPKECSREHKYNSSGKYRKSPVRIGVARDKAFCFYYKDNLEFLEKAGCELVEFSPLQDGRLPRNLRGLLLGGGYPELYLGELGSNVSMLGEVNKALAKGLPCLAECGGFMYLHEELLDGAGKAWHMAGVIQGRAFPLNKLVRFGYVELESLKGGVFLPEGERIKGHEFHYFDSTNNGEDCLAVKPDGKRSWKCVHMKDTLFAGYPHLHFYSNQDFALNFVESCKNLQ